MTAIQLLDRFILCFPCPFVHLIPLNRRNTATVMPFRKRLILATYRTSSVRTISKKVVLRGEITDRANAPAWSEWGLSD